MKVEGLTRHNVASHLQVRLLTNFILIISNFLTEMSCIDGEKRWFSIYLMTYAKFSQSCYRRQNHCFSVSSIKFITTEIMFTFEQKYRMQRRHILPKEDVKRAPHPRDLSQRNYYPHKHVMAFPPYHSNPILPAGQVYPAWGQPPGSYLTGAQTWGHAFYPPWQPTESWHWKPYSGVSVAWTHFSYASFRLVNLKDGLTLNFIKLHRG